MRKNGPKILHGPVAFQCPACGRITEFLDTEIHGYHREVARLEGDPIGPAKVRGEGPRAHFPCPQCRSTECVVAVAFFYWDAAFDLFLDEPELAAEDFFNELQSYGRCVKCGVVTAMTEFGKL
jgi:hypothetical protein